MTSPITVLIHVQAGFPNYYEIISGPSLNIVKSLHKLPMKKDVKLTEICKKCAEPIDFEIYWDSNVQEKLESEDLNHENKKILQAECVWDEPVAEIIKEESDDEVELEEQIDSVQKKRRKIESNIPECNTHQVLTEKSHLHKWNNPATPTVRIYPGIIYPLPENLNLPSFENVKGPYFEIIQHSTSSALIYIEKKGSKKSQLRVTNYDPRSSICDLCNYKVNDPQRLPTHRRQHMFPKFTDIQCRACKMICKTNDEKLNHSLFCTGKDLIDGLKCIECSQTCTSYEKLRIHMKVKHKGSNPVIEFPKERTVDCPLCGQQFTDNYSKTTHMKYSCPRANEYSVDKRKEIDEYLKMLDLPKEITLPDLYSIKPPYSRLHDQTDGNKIYVGKRDNRLQVMNFDPRLDKCDICGKTHIKNKNDMLEHRIEHFFPDNSLECKGCGRKCDTEEKRLNHSHFCSGKNQITVNVCVECKYQALNYAQYRQHLIEKHDGEGIGWNFMCHLCSASFEYRKYLTLHLLKHKDPKPFKCHHCSVDFKTKGSLATHLVRVHFPSAAKQICNVCSPPVLFAHDFKYRNHLSSVHLDVQTKEKKPCPLCGKHLANIKQHIKEQHTDPSKKKKFECNVCQKVFLSTYSLQSHSLVHLPENEKFKCMYCDRTFNRKNYCIEHQRTHTGEKPFKCETCDKAYARKQALRDHQREHTGQGYECSICHRMYTDRGNYRHHMKQHESQLGIKLTFNNEERRLMRLKVLTAEQALRGNIDD